MSELPRIDDLRRRLQMDPASIAFAQLAEECRRAGLYEEAVTTCQSGLKLHPEYTSARVTLGRALIELDRLDEARGELELVIAQAPENLSALRALAQLHQRRGSIADALAHYQRALALAPNDPELNRTVAALSSEEASAHSRAVVQADGGDHRPRRMVAELERWLEAIHVARAADRA